jgi:hypothetical protein
MEKYDVLKLFQEWQKGIKKNGREGEFKYNVFDIL